MKTNKVVLIILMLAFFTSSYSQSAKKMLSEISGKWQLDDNGNVTFLKIVEVSGIDKNEIYNRALNYFIYNYGNGNSTIQNQDKESGLIVGKGFYKNVQPRNSIFPTYINTWHIVRVDVREGKARIILTLTDYEKTKMDGDIILSTVMNRVQKEYPINSNALQNNMMAKAFYNSYKCAMNSLDAIEKAIKGGNTSTSIENSKW